MAEKNYETLDVAIANEFEQAFDNEANDEAKQAAYRNVIELYKIKNEADKIENEVKIALMEDAKSVVETKAHTNETIIKVVGEALIAVIGIAVYSSLFCKSIKFEESGHWPSSNSVKGLMSKLVPKVF